MRLRTDWYRCRDGKKRWLGRKASVARLMRAAGRCDRLRPGALRNFIATGGTRAVAKARAEPPAQPENDQCQD